ncbi:MAG: FecR family protein [Alphaproteobacteria bacterium]|nr:FecR family protein [Alphaproteobacteria bacterium]
MSGRHSIFWRVLSSLMGLALVLSPTISFAQTGVGNAGKVVNQVSGALQSKVRKIALKDQVYQNEKISTGSASATEITFKDETKLTIGPDSDVTLDNFVYKPGPVSGSLIMTVSKGVMRFTTGKLSKTSYLIKTPTATIGIRGTIFTVYVAANGATTVTVQAGAVSVSNAVGISQSVGVGQSTSVAPAPAGASAPPPSPPSAPPPQAQAAVSSMDNTVAAATGQPAGSKATGTATGGLTTGALAAGIAVAAAIAVAIAVVTSDDASQTSTSTSTSTATATD